MKILVENAPNTCYECLFLGEVKNNTHSGCTLLKVKIPFEIGMTTKLGNCPLMEHTDITLLRKAKDCLKQGIKQLEKYINYFEQMPEEDACIEMHETVLEIDKILGGMDK